MPETQSKTETFTPGPWFADNGDANGYWAIFQEADRQPVCYLVGVDKSPARLREAEEVANAKLIAAAPDLLASCKAQHEAIDRLFARLILLDKHFLPSESGQPWEALVRGNQAIAKAVGR